MEEGYKDRYVELEVVGEGSYGEGHIGVAMLVESVESKRRLVAKKIKLRTLKEKEKTAVLEEVMRI